MCSRPPTASRYACRCTTRRRLRRRVGTLRPLVLLGPVTDVQPEQTIRCKMPPVRAGKPRRQRLLHLLRWASYRRRFPTRQVSGGRRPPGKRPALSVPSCATCGKSSGMRGCSLIGFKTGYRGWSCCARTPPRPGHSPPHPRHLSQQPLPGCRRYRQPAIPAAW